MQRYDDNIAQSILSSLVVAKIGRVGLELSAEFEYIDANFAAAWA